MGARHESLMADRSLIEFSSVVPVLRADFNEPVDADGARCARADSWSLRPGDAVKLNDDEGTSMVGVVFGDPWMGPSGTRYVRVVAG